MNNPAKIAHCPPRQPKKYRHLPPPRLDEEIRHLPPPRLDEEMRYLPPPRLDEETRHLPPPVQSLLESPSEFVSYLANNAEHTARHLLKPYLKYETSLRRAFAKGETDIAPWANLVSIFNGSASLMTLRHRDRTILNPKKYIMRLPDEIGMGQKGSAVTPSLADYRLNFQGFTHGILRGLNWENIVVAGSAALLPLLSYRRPVKQDQVPSGRNPREVYYQETAPSSDIDIFLYGLDDDAAISKIFEIEKTVRGNQRLGEGDGLAMRSENAITLISPAWPFRHVQIILRIYKSISEILTGFDIDCSCVAYDGKHVLSNPRGIAAIVTRTNQIDLTRRSPSYENRLRKYRYQNFDIYWHGLERERVVYPENKDDDDPVRPGLARLLYLESFVKLEVKYSTQRSATNTAEGIHLDYWNKRRLGRIQDDGEPSLTTHSGYASQEVPMGERFTSELVRKYVHKHATEPYVFGSIRQVCYLGAPQKSGWRTSQRMTGRITFIKDNPGRQMIGSFYPLTDNDWTKYAYGEDE